MVASPVLGRDLAPVPVWLESVDDLEWALGEHLLAVALQHLVCYAFLDSEDHLNDVLELNARILQVLLAHRHSE